MEGYLIIQLQRQMSISEEEQKFLREDLHHLSSGMQSKDFNVRKFKVSQSFQEKRKPIATTYTMHSINKKSTQQLSQSFDEDQKRLSKTSALQGFVKNAKSQKNKTFHKQKQKMKTSISEDTELNPIVEKEELKRKRFLQMQKKYNKGHLNKTVLENWLNNILMQFLQLEFTDKTLDNIALKKFQIDQNSLISRGLKQQTVHRIYKSLFVYSFGYNSVLKDIVKSDVISKNIWRVFSVLLEYCAEGKFETTLGIIEKQKVLEVAQLQTEILKRQQIIEKNQQINEKKNSQIFRQIRYLKSQNISLTNQKDILYEDFQKTDQAFNEEVSLRLKFENRINQLFGVHRQLASKHERLYQDYKIKTFEWKQLTQKYGKLVVEYKKVKNELGEKNLLLDQQIKKNKLIQENIKAVKEQRQKSNEQLGMVNHLLSEEKRVSKEYLRRTTQLEIQIKNLTEIFVIKDKSWHDLNTEYELSIVENRKLYNVINEQRKQIEELLFQKKQFNNRILGLLTDSSFNKNKKEQYENLYLKTDTQLQKLIQTHEGLQLKVKILQEHNASLQSDLKVNYENIAQMHKKNHEIQYELQGLKQFERRFNPFLNQRKKLLQEKDDVIQKLEKEKAALQEMLKKAELKYTVYKSEKDPELEILKKTLQQFKKQEVQMENQDAIKTNKMKVYELHVQNLQQKLKEMTLKYKNELFQRQNVKQSYNQVINVIQKKNQYEKELHIKTSQLEDNILRKAQQLQKLGMKHEILNQVHERIKQTLNQQIQSLRKIVNKKSSFVHPFIHEDLAENFRIIKEKFIQTEKELQRKIKQIVYNHKQHQDLITRMNNTNTQKTQKLTQDYDKKIFKLEGEVEFEKKQKKKYKNRLGELEDIALVYKKKIEESRAEERQKVLKSIIQQKSKSIQELSSKLSIQVKKSTSLQQEIIRDQAKYSEQTYELTEKLRKTQNAHEEKVMDMNYEVQFLRNKVTTLQSQLDVHEEKLQKILEQKLSEKMRSAEKQFRQSKQSNFFRTKPQWEKMKEMQRSNPSLKKRNQISRKIQLASSYYNK